MVDGDASSNTATNGNGLVKVTEGRGRNRGNIDKSQGEVSGGVNELKNENESDHIKAE